MAKGQNKSGKRSSHYPYKKRCSICKKKLAKHLHNDIYYCKVCIWK